MLIVYSQLLMVGDNAMLIALIKTLFKSLFDLLEK